MGFGNTLREAREAKGYTVAQLAEMTHIMSRTIEGLEAEDFSSIAAPIYGRGFVKLCCQTLGLDPKPMVDEFMAIFNGEKPAVSSVPSVPPPEPTPDPETATEPEPPPDEPAFAEPVAAEEPPARAPINDLFNQPPEQVFAEEPARPATSRFAPPHPQDDDIGGSPFSLPAIPWRLIALVVVVLAVGWALVAGCGALYRALGTPDDGKSASKPSVTAAPAKTAVPDTAAKAPRTPKPVKPLYID